VKPYRVTIPGRTIPAGIVVSKIVRAPGRHFYVLKVTDSLGQPVWSKAKPVGTDKTLPIVSRVGLDFNTNFDELEFFNETFSDLNITFLAGQEKFVDDRLIGADVLDIARFDLQNLGAGASSGELKALAPYSVRYWTITNAGATRIDVYVGSGLGVYILSVPANTTLRLPSTYPIISIKNPGGAGVLCAVSYGGSLDLEQLI
jgi:hypothetical protein